MVRVTQSNLGSRWVTRWSTSPGRDAWVTFAVAPRVSTISKKREASMSTAGTVRFGRAGAREAREFFDDESPCSARSRRRAPRCDEYCAAGADLICERRQGERHPLATIAFGLPVERLVMA